MQMCVIELKERPGRPLFHLEHYIEGKYIKYNSNSGFVRDDNVRLTPQVGPCRAPCPISADLGPLQITIGLPFLSLPLYTPPYRERPPTWAELGYAARQSSACRCPRSPQPGLCSHLFLLAPQAFSHFTFERSGHQLIVVDIQGVGDLYTDPQIHTERGTDFGDGNLGRLGKPAWPQRPRFPAKFPGFLFTWASRPRWYMGLP